jgi:hypothetical protein
MIWNAAHPLPARASLGETLGGGNWIHARELALEIARTPGLKTHSKIERSYAGGKASRLGATVSRRGRELQETSVIIADLKFGTLKLAAD